MVNCIGFLIPRGPGDQTVKRVFAPADGDPPQPKLMMARFEPDPDQSDVPQGTTAEVVQAVKERYSLDPIVIEEMDVYLADIDESRECTLVFVPVKAGSAAHARQ